MADRGRMFARPDAPHGVHDLLLVAEYAAGDAQGNDRALAEALVAACDECAALVIDLQAIEQAVTALPAPARQRDFRLTPADAQRLRPHGVRGLVAAFARPRLEHAHPVAAGLTMLGLTGILITGLSFGWAGSAAAPSGAATGNDSVFQIEAAPGAAEGATAPPDIGETGLGGGAPAASSDRAAAAASPATRIGDADVPAVQPASFPTRLVILIGSVVLALAGLLLYLAARRQRRRFG